jgi:hypothetical protein
MGFPDRDASDCPGIIPGILQGFGGGGMVPVAQFIITFSLICALAFGAAQKTPPPTSA